MIYIFSNFIIRSNWITLIYYWLLFYLKALFRIKHMNIWFWLWENLFFWCVVLCFFASSNLYWTFFINFLIFISHSLLIFIVKRFFILRNNMLLLFHRQICLIIFLKRISQGIVRKYFLIALIKVVAFIKFNRCLFFLIYFIFLLYFDEILFYWFLDILFLLIKLLNAIFKFRINVLTLISAFYKWFCLRIW